MSQSKAMLQGASCPECGARASMAWDARGYPVCRRRCDGYLLAQERRGREHHITNARLRLRHGAPHCMIDCRIRTGRN
jgi:hypothetical protein